MVQFFWPTLYIGNAASGSKDGNRNGKRKNEICGYLKRGEKFVLRNGTNECASNDVILKSAGTQIALLFALSGRNPQ